VSRTGKWLLNAIGALSASSTRTSLFRRADLYPQQREQHRHESQRTGPVTTRKEETLSHVVSVQTRVHDPAAIAAACQRLGLAAPVQGTTHFTAAKRPGSSCGFRLEVPGRHRHIDRRHPLRQLRGYWATRSI